MSEGYQISWTITDSGNMLDMGTGQLWINPGTSQKNPHYYLNILVFHMPQLHCMQSPAQMGNPISKYSQTLQSMTSHVSLT